MHTPEDKRAPLGQIEIKPILRLFGVLVLLAILVALPFAIWGDQIEAVLTVDGAVEWMRGTGWAWAAGIGLIVSDIAIPIPSTAVMAGLGILYGPIVGGLLSAIGSIIAGSVGYWICRALGPRTAERLAGHKGLAQARNLFDRWGIVLVAVSRWVPVLPETVAFLAGLIRMPYPRFVAALAVGAIPLGFVFATAGHLGRDAPVLVMVGCAIAPVIGLGIWRLWKGR